MDSAIEANLFTMIFSTHHSWHSHPLMCFTGVRGHAPPEKCQNLRSVAFCHGSELTSTAVDDIMGIVQLDHKLLLFFQFKSAILNA